eukprot:CAMPEP_0203665826 /NCGR_PEP_ID=MMETSP0090-20130426/2982_1 /ASSEMBLY_ACC=CAM_ASM_001088 /TAXON_ID=426623 /ORGANISM="Chaetoceros affinis, Strain CCMP159" /LENGTH=493 /DNA_ID=CAMNT_0050529525 /DNA_START=459 /DNA_END=1940 /DNA_ORIENTATION=-
MIHHHVQNHDLNVNGNINLNGNINIDVGVDVNGSSNGNLNAPTIIMPIEEFAHDLEVKLGRANGNVYVRKAGVEGLHDGQIMVRLKKKRFIIIDYSIVPNAADIAFAAVTPNVLCPTGAGKQKCVSQDCTKVGVPVMLFDSDPEQPLSLYLRSGLCFTCQRLLNEKRRTQRKRKGDHPIQPAPGQHHPMGMGMVDGSGGMHHHGHPHQHQQHQHQHPYHNQYHSHPHHPGSNADQYGMETTKRFRLGGEILDLNPDAIIINGPLDDTKHHGPGYEYPEIANDLQRITQEVSQETVQLANTVSALGMNGTVGVGGVPFHNLNMTVNAQDHAQILALYEKTFVSISKGIFLLNQWKSSWDSAVVIATANTAGVGATAVEKVASEQVSSMTSVAGTANTAANSTPGISEAVSSADVVASAAAVAAAQSVSVAVPSGDRNSSEMIPLLLAANNNDHDDDDIDKRDGTMREDDVGLKVDHDDVVVDNDDEDKPEVFGV